jgi:hypothetical protein
MLPLLVLTLATAPASIHVSDNAPLIDPTRPVTRITRTGFSIQFATSKPCDTKIEVRQGDKLNIFQPGSEAGYRVVSKTGTALWHTLDVTGLQPGKRYFYRYYDPGANPTTVEAQWGAASPWSREYAVSTEAPAGRKTIIHIPVKVLLMPNVLNVESAVQPDGSIAPEPPKATPEQIEVIENEYRTAAKVFWQNSGMRLWVDFKFTIDDRWQRWGPDASAATPFYQHLPMCRSYAGKDYVEPGGGGFTVVDLANPTQVGSAPVHDGYVCQMENAWPRAWESATHQWRFYKSGGGTMGADDLPKGMPCQTQFLGGSDTAWLCEHEFHHQLESLGQFALANREDDRIVFDHPTPRHRQGRGKNDLEQAWNTAGPHGEQWDVMRYWDRTITDCQWLRFCFGTTETVADKDGDGFPDDDSRLPLDAKRFKRFTGTGSYDAAMNWDWVVVPLQSSWLKDRKPGAFLSDAIVPHTPAMDGDAPEWASIPLAAKADAMGATFQQCYDADAYYGLLVVRGNLDRIEVDLDDEARGMFVPPGPLGFVFHSDVAGAGQAGPVGSPVTVKPTIGGVGGKVPGMTYQAVRTQSGAIVVEFRIANNGASPWYWQGAGQSVGFSINVFGADGHGYSLGQPYKLNWCRMIEGRGQPQTP